MTTTFILSTAAAAFDPMLLVPPTMAYVGPGLGFGTIAAILGVIFSILLAIFAVVWYPIKRLLGIGRKPKTRADANQKSTGQEK